MENKVKELASELNQALSRDNNPSSTEWAPVANYRTDTLTPEDVDAVLRKSGWYDIYVRGDWDRVDERDDLQAWLVNAYLERKEPPRGLFVAGSLGVGKSTLLGLFARFFAKNFSLFPRFIPVGVLFDMYFDRQSEKISEFMRSTVLFLDDIARAYAADFPAAKFENFMEFRYANLLPTFISSDVDLESLGKKAGYERIADRIADPKWMRHMTYVGESKRRIKT